MFVHVERGSSGMLISGEKQPSVRELAQQLAVNVNTAFRIYERLAAEGLIDARRHGEQFEIVVDGAPRFRDELASAGHSVQPTAMTLDDIFEAFVIGRPQAWGEAWRPAENRSLDALVRANAN